MCRTVRGAQVCCAKLLIFTAESAGSVALALVLTGVRETGPLSHHRVAVDQAPSELKRTPAGLGFVLQGRVERQVVYLVGRLLFFNLCTHVPLGQVYID